MFCGRISESPSANSLSARNRALYGITAASEIRPYQPAAENALAEQRLVGADLRAARFLLVARALGDPPLAGIPRRVLRAIQGALHKSQMRRYL